MRKVSIHQKDTAILYMHVPNNKSFKINETKLQRTKIRNKLIHDYSWRF